MKKTYILLLAVIFLFTGCSTKKNTAMRRAYHNLTAYYNAYFNGNEALKRRLHAGRSSQRQLHSNNFNIPEGTEGRSVHYIRWTGALKSTKGNC